MNQQQYVPVQNSSETLAQRSTTYSAFLRMLPDPAVIIFGETVADANDAALALIGLSLDQVVGISAYDFIHPADIEIVRERQRRRLEGEPTDDLGEYRLVRPDGSSIWVEASAVLTEDAVAITILRDITSRKASEEELRNSQELLSRVVESIPIGIWVGDRDFNIRLWNVGQEVMTGVSRDDVLGLNIFQRFPSLADSGLEELYRSVIETGKPLSLNDFPFYDATLTKVQYYLNIKANPLRNLSGEVTGIVLAVEDITERKTAEIALGESEAKFRSYVNQSVDGIFIVDSSGRYLEVNPAGCEMLNYPVEELLGMTIRDVTSPDEENLATGMESFKAVIETGHSSWQGTLRRKDGSDVFVEVRAVIVGPNRYMGLVRDITEHKRSEQALMNSLAELKRAYALQSQFVRNMTHEVRTPLTGVIGYTQALLEGIAGDVSCEQKKVLKRIVGQAESLLGLVEEVLESATLAAGVQKLDMRMMRLDHIIPTVVRTCEPAAKERNVLIKTHLEPKLPVIVTDAQKLTRILSNLLFNAVKFTFKGSVSVSAERSVDGVDIIIEDTGTGIPPEKQENIFDAFVQLSYPGKHKPVGAGLGLSIVSELVDALGCSLTLSSVPEIGTAFTLHIPLRHSEIG